MLIRCIVKSARKMIPKRRFSKQNVSNVIQCHMMENTIKANLHGNVGICTNQEANITKLIQINQSTLFLVFPRIK